jgi:CubicO group peptidase (beta-lactamase class C family)
MRDLATHTSGLPRLPPQFRPANPRNPYADFTDDKLYAALAMTQLARDPGADYQYSNFGYMWLSDILARRAGKPFDALLKERVLDPLGMKDTALVLAPAPEGRVVTGHALPYEPTPPWVAQPAVSGSGGWRSSMNDMLKLAEALAGVRDTPLKQAIALAIDPLHPAFGRNSIGLAWNVHEGNSARVVWHNGGTGGFTSMIAANRAAKKAAVVLVDAAAPFEDLALHLVDPETPLRTGRASAPIEAAERDQFVGSYVVSEQLSIRVFVDGERLMGQASGQPPFELGRESGDRFFVRGIPDAQVTFRRGDDGRVDGLTLHQAGRDAFAARTPAP